MSFGKAVVRILELYQSINIVIQCLDKMPKGPIDSGIKDIPPGEGIGRHEAPRGEVVHYIMADGGNSPARHKIRAPSFMNVASNKKAVIGETISDATIILAAVDPCYCCTERMAVVDYKTGKKMMDGQDLIKRTNASDGLGDVVLKAKYQILEEDNYGFLPNVSIRTAVKFPTGDKKSLLGSGELDYGFGLLLDKTFSEKITVYAGCNFIIIEKPDFFSVLNIKRNMVSGIIGVEYLLKQRLSLVAQLTGNSTPYPSSGTNALDESAFDVGLGLNYIWKEKQNVSWHFAFTENINSASSPDVSFNTGWKVGF